MSTIEALPAEIKLLLMKSIPDPETLVNLTIASRTYNETYRTYRKTVLPPVLLNGIKNKGIFRYQPIAWMELCIDRRNPHGSEVELAIKRYYRQSREGLKVTMTYEECLPLIALKDARTWTTSPIGSCVMHTGGRVFESRVMAWAALEYDNHGHIFRVLSLDGAAPLHGCPIFNMRR